MPSKTIVEELKAKRLKFNLTVKAVSDMTNTAESTTRKVFSNGDTQYNFGIETLQPYIDLFDNLEASANDLKPAVDTTADDRRTVGLYERIIMDKNLRIEELNRQVESLEKAKAELMEANSERILRMDRNNKILFGVAAFLFALVVGLFVYDFANPDRGWVLHMFAGSRLQSIFGFIKV